MFEFGPPVIQLVAVSRIFTQVQEEPMLWGVRAPIWELSFHFISKARGGLLPSEIEHFALLYDWKSGMIILTHMV